MCPPAFASGRGLRVVRYVVDLQGASGGSDQFFKLIAERLGTALGGIYRGTVGTPSHILEIRGPLRWLLCHKAIFWGWIVRSSRMAVKRMELKVPEYTIRGSFTTGTLMLGM